VSWYEEYGIENPYYSDDSVCIVHSDCRDVAPRVPEQSIDLAVADFPFRHDVGLAEFISCISLDALRDGGNLLVIDNPHNLFKTKNLYSSFILRNEIALIRKREFCPAWHLGFKHNTALLLCKGDSKAIWNGNKVNHTHSVSDVMEDCHKAFKGHPEAISLDFALMMVNLLSGEDSVILDYFAGSGTFARACLQLGRKYIGTEKERGYCNLAVKRLMGL
jgi:hypothetical protein